MDDDQLRGWVRRDFGVEVTRFDEVGHGADERARLWRADAGSRQYAVKISGGTPSGLEISAHLGDAGVPGIPAPLRTRDGRVWSQRDGRRLSVVPWVSDHRALAGEMSAEHWVAFGELLAGVHAAEPVPGMPVETYTHDHVVTAVGALNNETDRETADELTRELLRVWRARADDVATLLTYADEVTIPPTRNVVCHSDPHLGNVLLQENGQLWLIDWDDAILAPPERDLLFMLGGVLAFRPVTPQQQRWFFDGYGTAELDPARLNYFRCVRALEDLTGPAAQIVDAEHRTASERSAAWEIVRGVLSDTGLVTTTMAALRRS